MSCLEAHDLVSVQSASSESPGAHRYPARSHPHRMAAAAVSGTARSAVRHEKHQLENVTNADADRRAFVDAARIEPVHSGPMEAAKRY